MKFLRGLFKKTARWASEQEGIKDSIKANFSVFEKLLQTNNRALELMADLEEKLSGEYLFDRQYITRIVGEISGEVLKLIEYLNTLAADKYKDLHVSYDFISQNLNAILASKKDIPAGDLAVPLEALNAEMNNVAGGKIAHLGEIKNRLGLPTPEGFSISSYAFMRFMEHNRLSEKINGMLSEASLEDMAALEDLSRKIQSEIACSEVPGELEEAVNSALERLKSRLGSPGALFSVRSSALYEDGEFSFAGQYLSALSVPGDMVLDRYKDVIASLFTPRAIFYYKTKGFSEDEMVMAVGIIAMVDARAGGVMYSRDPNEPEARRAIINSVRGLGTSVVDGTTEPETYVISLENGETIDRSIARQETMIECAPGGGLREVPVPDSIAGSPSLSDEEIRTLLSYALKLETHYGRPQDVEWAVGKDGKAYVLQSRPLRIAAQPIRSIPAVIKGYNILIGRGVIASKGIGFGKAFIIRDDEDLKSFPEGAVLVARHTSPKYVTVMSRAAAIVTDVGSITGHMASLSREYEVPTILDTHSATSVIKDGNPITVDAINCNIYEGRVPELIEQSSRKREPFKDTHLLKTLKKAAQWIVPLNLVEPDDENFSPAGCCTFHDITRFVHETAMAVIFKIGKGDPLETIEDFLSAIAFAEAGERVGMLASALKAGIPVDALILDIDGGLNKRSRKIMPEDIASIPFAAFLKGMTGMKWPEPRPVDAGGFFGMIARTASFTEEELRRAAEKSYAIISLNYMNFSIRLGYHFSNVEAYVGDSINDNYVKFFFKGGGAVLDRRLRRVRLIKEILRKMGYRVKITEDLITASITKYRPPEMESSLETLGRLTAFTKQLDMALYNDAITDMFIEEFLSRHFVGSGP